MDKPPVERFIKELSVLDWSFPEVAFEAEVSSGTYVRGLFEDLARALGTKGALTRLKRTAVGPCHIEDAIDPKEFDPAHLEYYAKEPSELLGFSA